MSDLQKHIDQLISFIHDWTKESLSWSRIFLVEAANVNYEKTILVPQSALSTPEEYATRFDSHLNTGHGWINMNAAGILDNALLIIIELPQYFNSVPREKVSVNFSGPNMSRWDATGHIEITE
jgi:hypothetical protein